jgi:hypothetical protein
METTGTKNKQVAYFYDEEVRRSAERCSSSETRAGCSCGGHGPFWSWQRQQRPSACAPTSPRSPTLTPCASAPQMTNYNSGGGNPMRPHRVRLTTGLVDGYGLTDKMQIMRPRSRSKEEIMLFHADGGEVLGVVLPAGLCFAAPAAPRSRGSLTLSL